MIWRIRERRAFQSLVRSGRRARTKSLWCSYLNDPEAVPLRVAFAVERSAGPATRRNRLRRQLRAIVADTSTKVGMDHGWLMIGISQNASELTYDLLLSEVQVLLRKAVAGG